MHKESGKLNQEITKLLSVNVCTISKWVSRFQQKGLQGLIDTPGRGRKHSISEKIVNTIITEATKPPKGLNGWSTRKMARPAGVSHYTVQKIWSNNDIKLHLTKTFKLSKDKNFEENFWDIMGLYLDPPEKVSVLCCDEKANVKHWREVSQVFLLELDI